jgi:hypothetical protein
MAVATLAPLVVATDPSPAAGAAAPPGTEERGTADLVPADAGDAPRSGFAELLTELRGDIGRRPEVDVGLSGGLRAWLEDGVAEICGRPLPQGFPLLITARSLRSALSANGGSTLPEEDRSVTLPMATGVLVGLLFRQLVTTGTIADPMRDALDGLSVEPGRSHVADFIAALGPRDRAVLAKELAVRSQMLRRRWTVLPRHWLPRSHDRITVPLGGGRVVLATTVDLLIGTPCTGRASVCLVLLRSGTPRPEDRADLHFAALLETLRSGAPPFRVVLHYTATGENRVEDLRETDLGRAVQRTIDGVGAIMTRATTSGDAARHATTCEMSGQHGERVGDPMLEGPS